MAFFSVVPGYESIPMMLFDQIFTRRSISPVHNWVVLAYFIPFFFVLDACETVSVGWIHMVLYLISRILL